MTSDHSMMTHSIAECVMRADASTGTEQQLTLGAYILFNWNLLFFPFFLHSFFHRLYFYSCYLTKLFRIG